MSDERIRVVRIIDRMNIGGPAKHVTWLSSGLDTDGFKSLLVTGTVPEGEGDMSYFAREAGINPVLIPEMSREISWRDLFVLWKLLRLLWRYKPHVIHTHKAKAGAVGRTAALIYKWASPSALRLRPRRCRVVHTFHGHVFHSYYSPAKSRLFVAIERMLARLATDRIVVISGEQRREIHERFGVGSAAQFSVIPLGIDLDGDERDAGREERISLRRELGLSDDRLLIGIIGRLSEVKNHALFLSAAARIIGDGAGAAGTPHFVIIGDGHLRPELESMARSLGIASRVSFTGFRRDTLALYAELDLVALSSLNEGTPLVLIEAMSAGRAVVSTEVGGVADLLGARLERRGRVSVWEHGLTVPSRDDEAFAEAMRMLIAQPELRCEMGERGRAFVRARLSKERLVREIAELYRELLKESR